MMGPGSVAHHADKNRIVSWAGDQTTRVCDMKTGEFRSVFLVTARSGEIIGLNGELAYRWTWVSQNRSATSMA
jgi:hypothetical protein